jgi:hypothetical protein
MVAECNAAAAVGQSFYSTEAHNPYLTEDDPTLPGQHPRNLPVASSKVIVDADRVQPRCPR